MDKRFSSFLVVTFTSVVLAGCGGGSGGSSAPASTPIIDSAVGGIWEGTTTLTDGTKYETAGFITEEGELRFITEDGAQQVGTISSTGSAINASITEYTAISAPTSGTVTGTINSRNTLTGSAKFGGVTTSTFDFKYDPIYDRGSSLAVVSGIYSDTDGAGYTETYTIDSDGIITGSDTDGCVFGGAVSILNSNYNMYRVELSVSNCADLDGLYKGLGALSDTHGSQNDTFIISLTGPAYVITGFVPRT